ncbi:MAG: hypothetical protein ACRD0W_14135 [Acidimicrobiales bacterium]
MGTVLVAVVAGVVGAVLGVSATLTLVNVAGGPTPQEVVEQRAAGESVTAEDLAYGNN